MMEPGRYLVGPAGLLLASVILEKQAGKRFLVLDAAMNDLMRPAMYDAWHGILPVAAAASGRRLRPRMWSGRSAKPRTASPRTARCRRWGQGARVAMLDAGAYGAVMSSTYNARPRAAAVLVDNGGFQLITRRQAPEELWAGEILPGA